VTQSVLYSLPHFFLQLFAIALVSFASSSNVQRAVATAFSSVSVEGSASLFTSSSSSSAAASEGGSARSGEAVFLATLSVVLSLVVGRGSSRRRFFLARAGISSACGGSDARFVGNCLCLVPLRGGGGGWGYQDSVRLAALRRNLPVPLLTASFGIIASGSAWSVRGGGACSYVAILAIQVIPLYLSRRPSRQIYHLVSYLWLPYRIRPGPKVNV
jgi:hypothetical protein